MAAVKKEVRIAEFKSRLSAYLRRVQNGQEIILKNRDTPIARVVAFEPEPKRLITIPPTRSLKEVEKLLSKAKPIKNLRWSDVMEALREERREQLDEVIK